MDTRNPGTDETQERARLVRVLRELVPAAVAVDDERREVVHELVALVLFVEHDAGASYVDIASERDDDVGEAVDGHGFPVLLWLSIGFRFFFWPKIPRFRPRQKKNWRRVILF